MTEISLDLLIVPHVCRDIHWHYTSIHDSNIIIGKMLCPKSGEMSSLQCSVWVVMGNWAVLIYYVILFFGSLTPLGGYVYCSHLLGHPLVVQNGWHNIWTVLNQKQLFLESSLFPSVLINSMPIIENAQTTIHLSQKWPSWAQWGPVRPSAAFLDGFHWMIGFFIIYIIFSEDP